jgi:hypothetical protein
MKFRANFICVLCALACSAEPVRFVAPPTGDASLDGSRPNDASLDVVPSMCTPGRWFCNGTQMAFRCGNDGKVVTTERCTGGARCVGGALSCGLCQPGTVRCNPDNVEAPQICATDGTRWEDRRACDTASGERCSDGACRRPCGDSTVVGNSYLGCEYWATPTPNSGLNYSFSYTVVLANPSRTDAHITVTGGRLGSLIERTIAPGGVERIDLPWTDILKGSSAACPLAPDCQAHSAFGRTAVRAGAFRVTSDVPITAYQFNPLEYRIGMGTQVTFSYTADASLLLPQNVLADPRNQEYLVMTRPNWSRDRLGVPFGGFVSVVAGGPQGDSVEVVVETRATVGDPNNRFRELPPGRHTFSLGRGEVLQLVGTRFGEDLTGTSVRANGPIAVFSGHDCTNVPEDLVACDHLEEQLLPVATWGRRYAVTVLRDRVAEPDESSIIRIMSQADDNRLMFDGTDIPPPCDRVLNRGEYCEFSSTANFVVSGTRPLLVGQFMKGQGARDICRPIGLGSPPDRDECVGDPAMVQEVPVEQYRRSYDLLIPSTYRFNFVNLVSMPGTAITLDGEDLAEDRVRGPFPVGAGLELRVLRVDAGAHNLSSRNNTAFGAKVYGVAAFTSYMYPVGLDLQSINPPG